MLAVFGATISPEPEGGNESKSFWHQYSLLIGLSILAFILIFLLTTTEQLTEQLTSSHVLFIDSELSSASENETPVLTKLDLSSSEHLKKFPAEIGDWRGSDYDTSTLETQMEADSMLMRAYSKPGLYQPIFFLVMQSGLQSSFHPPLVCYPALGYTIEEEGRETIPIVNTGWAATPSKEWPSVTKSPGYRSLYFQGSIPAKTLVVSKQSEGKVIERRVVLYFYIKDNKFMSNKLTMIRVSALAPLSGSYDGILNMEKEFVRDAFPYMFEIQQRKQGQGQMIIVHLANSGVGGCLLLAFLFSMPLAILIYPRLAGSQSRRKKKTRDDS